MTQTEVPVGRPVQVRALVEPQLREQLERLARAGDRSLAAEVRRALTAHVAVQRHAAA